MIDFITALSMCFRWRMNYIFFCKQYIFDPFSVVNTFNLLLILVVHLMSIFLFCTT